MVTMTDKRKEAVRAELQAWYLEGLQPKLARAARTGAVDPREIAACDAELRRFLRIAAVEENAA
jgi:hypothetical protein